MMHRKSVAMMMFKMYLSWTICLLHPFLKLECSIRKGFYASK